MGSFCIIGINEETGHSVESVVGKSLIFILRVQRYELSVQFVIHTRIYLQFHKT